MKTAIYIEQGDYQVVLTPESDFEKQALDKIRQHAITAKFMCGEFYACQGGYHRHSDYQSESSLIIRVQEKP